MSTIIFLNEKFFNSYILSLHYVSSIVRLYCIPLQFLKMGLIIRICSIFTKNDKRGLESLESLETCQVPLAERIKVRLCSPFAIKLDFTGKAIFHFP